MLPVEKTNLNSTKLKGTIIVIMCGAYIVNFFIHSKMFSYVLCILCVITFFYSLKASKSRPRYFSLIMFILALILNLYKGDGVEEIANGIMMNLPILTLVILVPLIAIPFKISGYFHSVQYFIKKMIHNSRKLFGSLSFFVACLGPVLNLGSIRVLHETVKDLKLPPILLAKSYLIGFSTVILWSPYFASVALVLYYLDVPVSTYIPLGLTLSITQLIVGNILFNFWVKNKEERLITTDSFSTFVKNNDETIHKRNLKLLFGTLLILMFTVFALENALHWPMMFLVSLVSISYPIVWCSLKRKWKVAKRYFIEFKNKSAPSMNNEIVLFISAGMFGKSLQGTVLADKIKLFLLQIAENSFLLFILTIIFIVVIFSFLGVHQIVVVTALATQIDPSLIGTSPEVVALLFMLSWSLGAVISPVNPLNLLVSGSIKTSGIAVGLQWNGVYLFCMFVIGVIFIYAVH